MDMAWTDALNDIVSRYAGGAGGAASAPADPHEDYKTIAQSASPQEMADALSNAFRSDQTPNFPDMVSGLFRESNPEQRAGLLSHLLSAIGPAAVASIPGLSGLAGNSVSGVTARQASRVTEDQVQQAAAQAQRENPSIIDRVSGFYAQHPDAVKGLGAAALTIAIQSIARRRP
jgi:hypothetical protein